MWSIRIASPSQSGNAGLSHLVTDVLVDIVFYEAKRPELQPILPNRQEKRTISDWPLQCGESSLIYHPSPIVTFVQESNLIEWTICGFLENVLYSQLRAAICRLFSPFTTLAPFPWKNFIQIISYTANARMHIAEKLGRTSSRRPPRGMILLLPVFLHSEGPVYWYSNQSDPRLLPSRFPHWVPKYTRCRNRR